MSTESRSPSISAGESVTSGSLRSPLSPPSDLGRAHEGTKVWSSVFFTFFSFHFSFFFTFFSLFHYFSKSFLKIENFHFKKRFGKK